MAEYVLNLEKLNRLVKDRKNVMLFGPDHHEERQVVTTYISGLQDGHQKVAFIDVSPQWNAIDFANCLSQILRETLKVESIGEPKNLSYQSILEDALYWADRMCEGKQMVLVFLEFHHVSEIPGGRVDASLRTIMQRLNNISFIFMSSQKEELSKIFILKSQPMYGMATTVNFL